MIALFVRKRKEQAMLKRTKIAKLIIIIYITIFFAGIASGCGKNPSARTEQAFLLVGTIDDARKKAQELISASK